MHSLLAALGLATALTAATEPAPMSLPTTLDLDPNEVSTVSISLLRATVDVRIEPDRAPSLTVKPIGSSPVAAQVRSWQDLRTFHLERTPEAEDGEKAEGRILVELVMQPGQVLELGGRDLDVSISAPKAKRPQPAAPAEDGTNPSGEDLASQFEDQAAWPYRLRLGRSKATLDGLLGGILLEGRESSLIVRHTGGPLSAQLQGGSLDLEDHLGPMRLTGAKSEVFFDLLQGGLLFDLDGGTLKTQGGEGTYHGVAKGGVVEILSWNGQARLAGDGTRVEIRESGPEADLELTGTGLDAIADRFTGRFQANLQGGSLLATDLTGLIEVSGRERARLELRGIRSGMEAESVKVALADESSAVVAEAEAWVRFDMTDSRLELLSVFRFGGKGERSHLTSRDIKIMETVSLKSSVYDLDLTQLSLVHQPAMASRRDNSGRLLLAQPCVVRLAGEVEDIEKGAKVTGCELVTLASSKAERMRGQGGYPEGYTVLVSNLEEGGQIEVKGVPLE